MDFFVKRQFDQTTHIAQVMLNFLAKMITLFLKQNYTFLFQPWGKIFKLCYNTFLFLKEEFVLVLRNFFFSFAKNLSLSANPIWFVKVLNFYILQNVCEKSISCTSKCLGFESGLTMLKVLHILCCHRISNKTVICWDFKIFLFLKRKVHTYAKFKSIFCPSKKCYRHETNEFLL